jgi:predicted permease
MLRKKPGFTAAAVVTLALGIGANAAIFSVLNAVALRRLPYDQPDQLVQLWEDPTGTGSGRNSVSGGVFTDWRQQSQAFQQISALWTIEGNLTGNDQPERLSGARVSAEFFDLLRVKPILGRTFLAQEDQPGHEQEVLIDHALWQRRFNGQTTILNQMIYLDGQACTVIGVLPPTFRFPLCKAEYWIPFGWGSAWWHQSRENNRLQVFARLRPGVTVDQARAQMRTITERLRPAYPAYKKDWGVTVGLLSESIIGDVRRPLLALMAAAGFVLLIACVNVANLTLVRTAARQRELALCSALGAGRWRLIRQRLVESLLLALCGGLLGVGMAFWGRDLLVAVSPQDLPRLQDVQVDARVLGFSLALSLATGILCGLAPARNALRLSLNDILKEGGRTALVGSPQRMSKVLIASEVALASILLVGAGLFTRSLQRLYSIDPGLEPAPVLTMQLRLPESRYPTGESRDRFFSQVLERIDALPGVEAAGVSTGLPFEGGHDNGVVLRGRPNTEYFGADYDFATPRYFEAMAIPLLKGRLFAEADGMLSPLPTIVNQAFVRKCLPDEDPIGKRIIENGRLEMEIVGVVGDVRGRFVALPSRPQYYKPMRATDWGNFNLFVRTRGDPLWLVLPVRKSILAQDPDQPIARPRTMTGVLSESLSGAGSLTVLSGGFSLLALLLAALGVYSVMAYGVTRRTREIGVRLAMGARRTDVIALVLRQGMTIVAIGLVLGLAGALVVTRFLASLLYEVKPHDPVTLLAVAALLASIAVVACYLAARRAARIDPMAALRCE